MQIILTHEQADFDALASLLGAHLLYETAQPVLPRRLNRNVRAFIALYGMEMPFIEQRDLTSEPIEQIILVDTQSMVSIKGVKPQTSVLVIDHHPLRDNLPENWSLTIEEIGATTTLLIEALRERNGILSSIQATLLLLGIYEDTGSLTYTRTTARDLRAAAYLLEQGASLQIASDYLNHPMSPAQQALYVELQAGMQILRIHGHTIILACGDAYEMEEELSTIAHKLREVFDPDALFLIISTRSGVQIIARSTTDHIDVAQVMANFGGGGHERAAASLVRDLTSAQVCAELKGSLPGFVQPAITVAQIMSGRPQMLSPDVPVEQAAERMQRYGHEGFPVVQKGQVVGLLTRRAVDRAMSHQYSRSISSLMDAGNYTVVPEDSIEHVQNLVAESGWGQIPVVHPQSKEIIGIVTRTDLLKTLAPAPVIPGRLNLGKKLEEALPAGRLSLLKKIAEVALEHRAALYIVGGFVRDLILEKPSLDFDLVVEGDAIALGETLVRRFGGRVTSHGRFGTAKWHLDEVSIPGNGKNLLVSGLKELDLVSARTEFYTHPTALPTVERGSIKLDLHRRDFTINTLALRLDGAHYGELHDYWGGVEDLHNGVVKVLHSLSFVDDPTRILRAVRFEQRLGFSIDSRTKELLQEARPLIERLSGERIRHELNHIFLDNSVAKIMDRLQALDVLQFIHPSLGWNSWLTSQLNAFMNSPDETWKLKKFNDPDELRTILSYILWLLRLDSESLRQVRKRLKFSMEMGKEIREANLLYQDREKLISMTPSQVTNYLDQFSSLAVFVVRKSVAKPGLERLLDSYATNWCEISPTITGHDLKKKGIPPGPEYGKILNRLRDAWINGEISTTEEENTFLQTLIPPENLRKEG